MPRTRRPLPSGLPYQNGSKGYEAQLPVGALDLIARKVYGDADRWSELAELNGISKGKPYRMGDCLMICDVYW